MSEFVCACGELIMPSRGQCTACGGRAVSMDGMSNRELAAGERMREVWDEEERFLEHMRQEEQALEENYGAIGEEQGSC